MAKINADAWLPEPFDSEVLTKVNSESAIEAHARKIRMSADTQTVPRSDDAEPAVIAKGGTYTTASATLDTVVLTARKYGYLVDVTEEDLDDTVADVLQDRLVNAGRGFARKFDNGCLGVSVAADGTDAAPFESVYFAVSTEGASHVTGDATYDNLSATLGEYEQGDYFAPSDTIVIASPAYLEALRAIKDTAGMPVFQQGANPSEDRLFGYQIHWSNGARVSATASANPTGNPLLIVGNKRFLLNGVRSGPESMISKEASWNTDGVQLKFRARRGFAVGRVGAFALLEKTV